MVRIKICGMTRRKDVDIASRFGADALGFILASSPRQVSLQRTKLLSSDLPPFISRVGVVVNPSKEELQEIIDSHLFDYIQFHGEEDPGMLAKVPLKTIKAISLADGEDLQKIDKYGESTDVFLFDTLYQGQRGGTGKSFDWELLKKYSRAQPFILAGGLGSENVIEAIRSVKPDGIDINSRLEKQPGVKDEQLLKTTLSKINKYNYFNSRKGEKDE